MFKWCDTRTLKYPQTDTCHCKLDIHVFILIYNTFQVTHCPPWAGATATWAHVTCTRGCLSRRHVRCWVWATWRVTWRASTRARGTTASATSQWRPESSSRSNVSTSKHVTCYMIYVIVFTVYTSNPFRNASMSYPVYRYMTHAVTGTRNMAQFWLM